MIGRATLACFLVSMFAMPGLAAEAVQKVSVHPQRISLSGPRDEQRLGVLGVAGDGAQTDLSREATFRSSNPAVATVTRGVVRPVGDGEAVIHVEAGGVSVTVPVKVDRATAEVPVSFSREVTPILTKAGCNMGACHGAQHGRGGFKLSLLGFDPTFDYPQIVQSAEGRRVVLSDPDRSILLQKPTLLMEHVGGERLKVNGREYNTIRSWLADGAPEPTAKDPTVTSLEVWPPKRVVKEGDRQQLIVRATWSDGRVEDVTNTAQYDALNEAIASVTPAGQVTAKGRGETHVMVRFCGQAVVAQVTLPFQTGAAASQMPAHNFIDEKLNAKWKDLGLTPSPLCPDEVFFRRVYLDLIGTLPTAKEIKEFLADTSADKRAKVIDAVLARPEFVDFWALKWGDLLRINRDQLQDKGMWSFHNWVRAALRDGVPLDEFVRDVLTAEGSTFTEGPANFYRTASNPTDWSENAVQVFLGIRLQCAKCHHHPFEKWSQDDYYGMAAFFVRLGTKNSQEFGLFGRESAIFLRPTGEINHPRTGRVVPPHPLDGPEMDDRLDRRRKLAEWLTSPNNSMFSRNLANRFWGYLMGRGLVEPMDDMRATNPASNPELLDALATDLVEHKFDLKHLLKTIVSSRAYQLSSVSAPGNEVDRHNIYFTRYTVKRLTAEQLADAMDFATGTREKYQGLPQGTRAIQLPDTNVRSYLMDVFGRPARAITCECERTMQPNIGQAMHLLNGDFLNKKLTAAGGRIEEVIKAKATPDVVVEELYLSTLSRPPRPEEVSKAKEYLSATPNEREWAQDLLWALLNSKEFLFNH